MLLEMFGAIAQLGERLNGIQEVRGSIPRSSTIFIQQNLLFKISVAANAHQNKMRN
tara:strand:+ start:295 stop:462 length:168 start_codon:yes stop_codon:yes gene_type:complete